MKWMWVAVAVPLAIGCGGARRGVPHQPAPPAQVRPVSSPPTVGGVSALAPVAGGHLGAGEVVAHRHPLPKPELPVIRPFNPPLPDDAGLKFAPPPADPSRLPAPVPPLPTVPVQLPAFEPPEPVLLPATLPPPVVPLDGPRG